MNHAPKARPILFSDPMVRAILAGDKTQTRRVVNPQPSGGVRSSPFSPTGLEDGHGRPLRCPYGAPGDGLWVRETWASADCMYTTHECGPPNAVAYRADKSGRLADRPVGKFDLASWNFKLLTWKSSRFMPRWASRLTLDVVSVRVERVQDITEDDAKAEGMEHYADAAYSRTWREDGWELRDVFATGWDNLHGGPLGKTPERLWDANPWCWRLEFRRVA